MSNGEGLPKGWVNARIDDLVTLVNGSAFKPTDWGQTGLPIVRIQNLNNPEAPFNYFSGNRPEKFLIDTGDLLFAWSGTPGTSFGAHVWRGGRAWLNQHIFHVVFDRDNLDLRFLRLAINRNLDQYITAAHGGAGLAHITKGRFEESELLIAPLPEQRRIVAKIEELFSDLDAGVAALERVRAKLKRYRAAVLKAAVDGKLTEEWRKRNRPKETGRQLLDRILQERRCRWEQEQLAAYEKVGKKPPPDWKDRYKEPAGPDESSLPELPEGWCWASMDALTVSGPQNGLYLPHSMYGAGMPIMRIDDFQNSGSRTSDELRRVNADAGDIAHYSLRENDLVVNRVNSMTHLGKCLAVEQRNLPALFESNMMRLTVSSFICVRFIQTYLRSQCGRTRLTHNAKWAVNQASINQQDVLNTAVPLPPTAEQYEIATEAEHHISVIQESESQIAANLKRSARLRQSVLKRAFEGKLVPQDPNDEPASVLLERIKAAKENGNPKTTTKPARKTK